MGNYEDGSFILLGPPGRRWLFSTKEAVVSPVTIYTNQGIISNQDKKGGRKSDDKHSVSSSTNE
ncbi:hypothetical protein KDN24_11010 [Bacillus sp. Bva_UNVM-123]|uniref:hypothetical protein n=1 Tax=Bacillus sp. Bva_UNVM-123 TaxID=2829798 RepID=UPI00391F56CB